MLVCVGTQCVPSVATRVVAKIYRPFFFFFCESSLFRIIDKVMVYYMKSYRVARGTASAPGGARIRSCLRSLVVRNSCAHRHTPQKEVPVEMSVGGLSGHTRDDL